MHVVEYPSHKLVRIVVLVVVEKLVCLFDRRYELFVV